MFKKFTRIPEPLQKQILIRFGLGVLFLILLIAVVTIDFDIYLWLPCAAMAVFMFVAAIALYRRAETGGYVVVTGICSAVEVTPVRKRAKALILKTDECTLKIMLRGRVRKITAGSEITLYIANNTLLHEHNGSQMLYNYLAMEKMRLGEVK